MLYQKLDATFLPTNNAKQFNQFYNLCFFIPGINIITELISDINIVQKFYEDAKNNDSLVKVSDKDVELFKKLDKKNQMFYYSDFGERKLGEEVFAIGEKKTYVINDPNLSSLKYDKLFPLDYSLNEVKILNNITGYTYKVGTIDGENVAIIGIPNSSSSFNRVRFSHENILESHKYEMMDLDEANNKTFTVYPFIYDEKTKAKLDIAVEEIKKSRIENGLFNETVLSNDKEINLEQSDSYVNEVDGPVLRKTKTNIKK